MSWASLANNQAVSCNNLQDAVNNGVFTIKNSIPSSNKEITKSEAEYYVYIDSIPSKTVNQLVVKSNLVANSPIFYITAVVQNGSIYRSTDGGSTFSAISGTAGQSWYDVSISTDGKYQLAAASNRWESSDYGATWYNDTNFPYVTPIAVGVSGTGQYQLAVPDYNYIAYSSNYGGSWTNSVTGGQFYWGTGDISKTGQYALVGGNSGPVKVSSNYGVDFSNAAGSINSISRNWLASAVSGTGQYMIICENGANVWKSSDYGSTWATIPSIGTGAWRAASISSTGQYMLIGVYGGYLYYSNDYGATWTVTYDGATANWRSATISTTGQYQCVAIQGGYIIFSNNYGLGWSNLISAGSRNWTGVAISG